MTIESDRPQTHQYRSGTERSMTENNNSGTMSPKINPIQYKFSSERKGEIQVSEHQCKPLKPILKPGAAGQHF